MTRTEQRLHQAAACLPIPSCSYEAVEARANHRRSPAGSPRRFRQLCAICAAIFLLAGCTTWAATTSIRYGAWATSSSSFRDAEQKADRLNFVLPENLAGSPFYQTTTLHVVPEGTTYLEALVTPQYRWYSIHYAIRSPSQRNSSVPYDDSENDISVGFGTTENGLWRHCFGFNEDGIWSPDNLVPGSYRVTEYKGLLLQSGTTSRYWEATDETTYNNWVHWVDGTRNICIGISADTDFDTLIEYAKELINLNQQ